MLKLIEVLWAIEAIRSDPFLSHEEGIAILRELKSEIPAPEYSGAKKATSEILLKKIAEAMEFLREDSPDDKRQRPQAEAASEDQGKASEETMEPTGDTGVSVEHPVATPRPAVASPRKRGSKK